MVSTRFLVLVALLLAPAAAAQDNACPQFFPGGTPPAFANPRLAQGAVLLCNDGFAVTASSVNPRAQVTGAWLCSNADHPACQVLGIDALAGQVGIDPFPGLPPTVKARMLPLRLPDDSTGGPRHPG